MTANSRQEISRIILDLKEKKGYSYRDLEIKTGISRSTIQRYVENTSSKFPMNNLILIAKALGTSPEELMGWDDSKEISKNKVYDDKVQKLSSAMSRMSNKDIEKMFALLRLSFDEIDEEFRKD